ncbi:MAG TPA: PD-(D/E)XK nuclease family protein [Bacteroidales bacterium]|nr:PD-(D/E)XK nuclease family protein [Bacteroidales bacterium]
MNYFLEQIAESLHSEFGNTLNRHCLVFPNRRAGLYFLKYLAAGIEKPVWVPSIFTINEFFRSYSSLQPAGNEILLFELYKVYRKLKKSPESFDDFYFWGDMLLNDFDDVDKYLVDASLLFRNVQDIKTIDQQFGGLTEEQVEIIKRFWLNFNSGKSTNEKSGFINIWSILNDLYSGFKSILKKQNLAYEGMIFREMAENSDNESLPGTHWEMVHFIGFNALNTCEKVIMTRFKKTGKARFYWDYDNSYIKEGKLNSAGFFLRENLKIFGNDMPSGWSYDTMLTAGAPLVRRRVIDTSSDVAQVKLISQLIEELPDLTSGNAHHTAVVLADENLLMTVLTSLPENIGDINITMGHPIKQTLVYTLVRHLMELQRTAIITDGVIRFSYLHVLGILKHTLVSGLLNESDNEIINEIAKTNLIWVPSDRFNQSEHLLRIFIKPSTPALLSDYFKDIFSLIALSDDKNNDNIENRSVQRNIRNEFIYRIVLSINRLETIVNSAEVSFTSDTYMRILDRMLRIQSVPFSGEPLSGVQIMGILETRVLDFKNLIILSVNEGVLPAVSTGSSFIPYSLREAFSLPSLNYQESIYAYHFYRLLQRAENVTFTYNSNSDGLRSGEMSRFLIQMKYEPVMKPEFIDLNFEIKSHGSIREIIERSEDHMFQLNSQFLEKGKGRILSPSAINTWLNCRMKFYYRYINRLKEPEKVTTDIDPAMFGNILHEIMRCLYHDLSGKVLTGDMLYSIIRDRHMLEKVTNETINEKFNKGNDSLIGGNELIVRDVLMAYLIRILNTDKSLAPFTILNLEDSFSFIIPTLSNGSEIEVLAGGKVDRIDIVNGVTRVVDYKTGTVADAVNSISDLFTDDRKKDIDGWLQTLLYCEAYLSNKPLTVVRPSVYKIKKLHGGFLTDKLRLKTDNKSELVIDDYELVRGEFMDGLKGLISAIFSKDEPFTMTSDIRGKCSYCPYRSLCLR